MTLDDLLADGPRLLGSRCSDCATVTFPPQSSCPRCTSEQVERHVLAAHGTIWSWTVQAFPPKEPFLGADAPFTPFAVAYVDLGGVVLVESRIVMDDLASLRIGLPVELVVEPFHGRSAYAFAPVGAA